MGGGPLPRAWPLLLAVAAAAASTRPLPPPPPAPAAAAGGPYTAAAAAAPALLKGAELGAAIHAAARALAMTAAAEAETASPPGWRCCGAGEPLQAGQCRRQVGAQRNARNAASKEWTGAEGVNTAGGRRRRGVAAVSRPCRQGGADAAGAG